ncbi:MAG: M28 family peptidase [Leptolyngbya sp. SIO3F4]|nr:M28 family peptidase [Leptolyngbya sp. SIO3F4]
MIHEKLKELLTEHLQELVRERDPYIATQGYYYVRHYIQSQLECWGPVTVMAFRQKGREHYNLYLDVQGQQQSLSPVVIGAHYDTVPGSPGADDNATGLAVLLALAQLFSEHQPRRSVRLIAFDLEESGLIGSRTYVSTLQGQPVYLMLSLEMLGYCVSESAEQPSQSYPLAAMNYLYPKTGNFIALIGNWQTIPIMWGLKRSFQRAGVHSAWLPMVKRGLPLPSTRRSDHAPFWDVGYNAIMVTDTADLRNPHYHRLTDTLDTLDLDFLTKVCTGLWQSIRQL